MKAILADADLRQKLMVSTIQATQAREGIETTKEQAGRAYYVVTEAERAAFFDLERFKAGKGQPERRHEMFVRALREQIEQTRFDVPRRDFSVIDGVPLAFRRVGIVSHIFRNHPPLEPAWAIARQGKATGDDSRWVRQRWEVLDGTGWVPFAKGGEFCRFYSDVDLVIDWKQEHREALKASGNALPSLEHYFKPGLTWPLRTVKGFNIRILPEGCVFGHKGPALFPRIASSDAFLLGVMNSRLAEFILRTFTSFSWEVGVIKRLPIPEPTSASRDQISCIASAIHAAKASWDNGNETSTHFRAPWCLWENLVGSPSQIASCIDRVLAHETAEEARIRELYAELNDDVYKLYGIPDSTRATVGEILGERPPEVLWPQMEGKATEQKRLEHVWRLLSFAVKRVIEADDDGIVPFTQATGETRLVDRVRHELATFFPDREESQLEVEIVNELKRGAKGYRKCAGLDDWLANAFFEYHVSLYKSRPTFWHIASTQGTTPFAFGVLVHYHRFDKNRMAKLRASYVRDTIEELRRDAGLADKAGRADDRVELQAKVEEVQALDKKLQQIQEGHHEGPEGGDLDFRILTPWKKPHERPKGWDPDIDDGVKVNIEPLQKAAVLRIAKVV